VRSRLIRNIERSRVLVTLKTGDAFLGVLYDHDSKALTLRNCEAVGANSDKTNAPVDGELLLLLADVAFLQRP
jgi:small nuclear ribonucleoprotein (snRNP)-like protein